MKRQEKHIECGIEVGISNVGSLWLWLWTLNKVIIQNKTKKNSFFSTA